MNEENECGWITDDMFIKKLEEIVDRQKPSSIILSIEGIYEILSEHFNNQILEELENER